jgi:thiamine kinase-like enzyme
MHMAYSSKVHNLTSCKNNNSTISAPIMFAHNDLLYENMMFNKEEGWPSSWLEV